MKKREFDLHEKAKGVGKFLEVKQASHILENGMILVAWHLLLLLRLLGSLGLCRVLAELESGRCDHLVARTARLQLLQSVWVSADDLGLVVLSHVLIADRGRVGRVLIGGSVPRLKVQHEVASYG